MSSVPLYQPLLPLLRVVTVSLLILVAQAFVDAFGPNFETSNKMMQQPTPSPILIFEGIRTTKQQ